MGQLLCPSVVRTLHPFSYSPLFRFPSEWEWLASWVKELTFFSPLFPPHFTGTNAAWRWLRCINMEPASMLFFFGIPSCLPPCNSSMHNRRGPCPLLVVYPELYSAQAMCTIYQQLVTWALSYLTCNQFFLFYDCFCFFFILLWSHIITLYLTSAVRF